MVGEKEVSPYFSLSVLQIFTLLGKEFEDFHFFGNRLSKFAFSRKFFIKFVLFLGKNCKNLYFFGKKICTFFLGNNC